MFFGSDQSLFSKLTTPASARRRQSNRVAGNSLDFTTLERRELLASIVFDAASSHVTIYGSSGNDAAYINTVGASDISVAVTGAATQNFSAAAVNRITFYAGAGNDLFENNTAVSSFFGAHTGNDTFRGGSGNDSAFGGAGQDNLDGRGGEDLLHGGDDADIVRGGDGDDDVHGNGGDDFVYGDAGNDLLWGERENDTIYGGDGNDTVYAFVGDDTIYGEAGNDRIYGQFGNDVIYGGIGDDILRGNHGNDTIEGDAGHDYLLGDDGDDTLVGGNGNDVLNAWIGNDTLEGNAGNDELYGGDGDDTIDGGAGDDLIGGQAGHDHLRGGDGDDRIYGQTGNDVIYGGAGADTLVGNEGDDSLFGGELSETDTLVGNDGRDRFLVHASSNSDNTLLDTVVGLNPNQDAIVKFIRFDNDWTDKEIEILDGGFAELYERTGNVELLKDSLPSGDLRFFKYGANSLNGNAGLNTLRTSSRTVTNSAGVSTTTHTYTREIRIADWNENSAFDNSQFRSVALHELAHNWDGDTELTTVGLGNLWEDWLSLSGWSQSSGGAWSKTASSGAFAESYGETNPYEDFGTVWELYFSGDADSVSNSTLNAKLDALDSLFSTLAT